MPKNEYVLVNTLFKQRQEKYLINKIKNHEIDILALVKIIKMLVPGFVPK